MIAEMARRPLGMLLLLASAAGGPYVLYETEGGKQVRTAANDWFLRGNSSARNASDLWQGESSSWVADAGALPAPHVPPIPLGIPVATTRHSGPATTVPAKTADLWNYTVGVPGLTDLQQNSPTSTLMGHPIHDLREVLRFDIAPGWVPQRFARVSTVLADVNLDGLRAALVTGTQSIDLAGTISYYFDKQQSLRRINLQAITGDATGLVGLMEQYYNLKPEPSLGGHLYTTRWNNRVTSLLHVAPAPIMYANARHSRYVVFLELNQPSLPYGLSYEGSQILSTGHQTYRW
jgi:hypothetical protein